MSHYTVLVIGENPESLLEPFNENTNVEPYKQYLDKRDIERMAEHYKTKENSKLITHMNDWKGSNGGIDDNGLFYWSTYNPKSKWDWFQIGGRWPGQLVLKSNPQYDYDLGEPSWTYRQSKEGTNMLAQMVKEKRVSQARNSDIDWEMTNAPRQEELKELSELWEYAVNGIEPSPENKPILVYKKEYYLDRFHTKEEFIKRSVQFTTYAVITEDGEWHAPGEMHFFGFSNESHEAQELWDKNFYELFIKPLKKDTLLTIVDCHI